MRNVIKSKPLLILSVLVFIYVGIAFLAPVLLKNGYSGMATTIYEVYERFCHQRVERSIFIFGESSFYRVQDLKEDGFIPSNSESDSYPEYFGHDYNGDENVGYKVAICIRDVALYLSFAIVLLVLSVKGTKVYPWWLVIGLIAPIFLDVGIQAIFETLRLQGGYLSFINNLSKRVITGLLAGIGVGLGLSNLIAKSLTNDSKKGDNQK
jgi:uncharacterized membrane protein